MPSSTVTTSCSTTRSPSSTPQAPTIDQTPVSVRRECGADRRVGIEEGELGQLDGDAADRARVGERHRVVVGDRESAVDADVEAGTPDLPPEREVLRQATVAN